MMRVIDWLLNRVTMYRLVLYYLIVLLGAGIVLSILHVLPYDPFALLFMIGFLVAVCWVTNTIFAWAFQVPANVESVYISALILALIITPLSGYGDLWFIGWAAVLAMASKYVVAIGRKHIFNPVAFAVAITALTINGNASWWVGNLSMLPVVVIGGLLVVRKIRRFDLVLGFFVGALMTIFAFTILGRGNLLAELQNVAFYSPLFFFAFVILTEPLTTPPTRRLQLIYGLLVGFLFAPEFHIGSFYLTPELAILICNVFAYIVSPKTKLILTLREKLQLSPDTWEFVFTPGRRLAFAPGQYMEWTLGHHDPDTRGNRRYFTIASAPTEDKLRLGVKFYPESSTYKQAMLDMEADDEIVAAQIAGDFTLPEDRRQRLVFIAGGIGITPYRSMLKHMLDTRQKRPITVFYSNKSVKDIVYKDVLDQAQRELGVRVIYTLTDAINIPVGWNGLVGRITEETVRRQVPEYRNCIFYISGPNAMVDSMKDVLQRLRIPSEHIKTDYFSGLA
ncbi:MAG TPA: RnfABCDGE type electron transport complex subunit D [Phototrophicaceae bacterium]|nr:RnfABCDGE type electron transport complex subunit D [Phototrophicaceae bacterium]